MPSGMLKIKDNAPIHGMNTVDDPKRLKDGECVRLLNAFPQNPPILRNGCSGSLLVLIDEKDEFIPPAICFGDYTLVWIYNDTEKKYYLAVYTSAAPADIAETGHAGLTDPVFNMLDLHSCIYAFLNQAMASWHPASGSEDTTAALGNKVIESSAIVRDMCISVAGAVSALTQSVDAGPFSNGDCFDYAFEYVRRNDAASFKAGSTPSGMILPVGITGVPQRIDTFLPGMCIGIEDVDNRKAIQITADASKTTLDISNSHASAILQGATHLRVCRSRRQDSTVNAQGATKFFLCDLPIGVATKTYDDTTTDAALSGETNQLITGYSVAPVAPYAEYHNGFLFIMTEEGLVYYSESPGGDGGTDEELSQTYPQAWASMFKPLTYRIDCDSFDGTKGTGIIALENDVFFFKESSISAVFGGDPKSAAKSIVSDHIGCPFPHTIKRVTLKGIGTVIYFQSNEGPYILTTGGRIQPFGEFKIKELWPKLSNELYGDLVSHQTHIVNNCLAEYFRDTIWIIYKNYSGIYRVFGYYMDQTNENAKGCLELDIAGSIITTNTNEGASISCEVSYISQHFYDLRYRYAGPKNVGHISGFIEKLADINLNFHTSDKFYAEMNCVFTVHAVNYVMYYYLTNGCFAIIANGNHTFTINLPDESGYNLPNTLWQDGVSIKIKLLYEGAGIWKLYLNGIKQTGVMVGGSLVDDLPIIPMPISGSMTRIAWGESSSEFTISNINIYKWVE